MNENDKIKTEKIEKTEKIGKKSKGDFFLKIISVFAAVLIWFWVVGFESQVTQRRFAAIPVIFENVTDRLAPLDDKEIFIDVILEGKSADLNRVKREDINAFIDFSRVTQAGQQSLPIEIREMDYVHVFSQSQNSTLLYIDEEGIEQIPVEHQLLSVHDTDIDIGSLILNPSVVAVRGPKGVLNNISHALVKLSVGKIERSITVTEEYVLINNNGEEVNNPYITKETPVITIEIPVTKTKEVDLAVSYRHGYYNLKNTNVTITPEKIILRGSPDDINNIHEILIDVIDEKQYERDTIITRPINPPSGVINLSGSDTAQIEIKFIDTEPKLINVSTRQNINFNVIPPSNLEYRIREERVQVRLMGHPSVLRSINSSRISVTADMSALTERGSHSIPLVVNIINNDSDNPAFCVGEYLITVEIY